MGSTAAPAAGQRDYLVSLTVHVPGVQFRLIVLELAVPEQVCGPLSVSLPSLATVPLKPSKGAAKASEQSV